MPKQRIFIAIDIPRELKTLAEQELKFFFSDKNVRIAKKENWHITVSFLGYLDKEEIKKLMEIVREIASQTKPFRIRPDKIMFAPPNRPKRMIWLNFQSSREFGNLKNKIQKENRKTHIHLTLARFQEKHFSNIKKFLPEQGIDLKNKTEPFLIDKISIMESFLSREGAEYQELASFKLKE